MYWEDFQISVDWLYTSEAEREVCHQDQLMLEHTHKEGKSWLSQSEGKQTYVHDMKQTHFF